MAFTDIDLAILSQASYNVSRRYEGMSLYEVLTDSNMNDYLKENLGSGYTKHLSTLIERVKESSYTIVKVQDNTQNGFAAFAVKDPNNNVTVACRGTELGKLKSDPSTALLDLGEDVKLALSRETAQQADMAKFMDDIQRGNYDSYSFTGHSLGGNLAMYGAITLDDPSKLAQCKTFNAPGFNSNFHRDHKDDIAAVEDRITSYQNKYDGVSEALTVPGNVVILDSKKKSNWGVSGHMLDDLVIKDGQFKTSKSQKKAITALGSLLYITSRLPDSMLILGPVGPSIRNMAATNISMAGNGLSSELINTSVGVSGNSQKIQLTPSELRGLASQMVSLSDEYNSLFDNVISELNRVNGNWSANLANNFAGKITSAQGKFKHIPDMLASGAAVANLSANNYEDTDSLLTKVIAGDLNKQDEGNIVGVLRNSGNI